MFTPVLGTALVLVTRADIDSLIRRLRTCYLLNDSSEVMAMVRLMMIVAVETFTENCQS